MNGKQSKPVYNLPDLPTFDIPDLQDTNSKVSTSSSESSTPPSLKTEPRVAPLNQMTKNTTTVNNGTNPNPNVNANTNANPNIPTTTVDVSHLSFLDMLKQAPFINGPNMVSLDARATIPTNGQQFTTQMMRFPIIKLENPPQNVNIQPPSRVVAAATTQQSATGVPIFTSTQQTQTQPQPPSTHRSQSQQQKQKPTIIGNGILPKSTESHSDTDSDSESEHKLNTVTVRVSDAVSAIVDDWTDTQLRKFRKYVKKYSKDNRWHKIVKKMQKYRPMVSLEALQHKWAQLNGNVTPNGTNPNAIANHTSNHNIAFSSSSTPSSSAAASSSDMYSPQIKVENTSDDFDMHHSSSVSTASATPFNNKSSSSSTAVGKHNKSKKSSKKTKNSKKSKNKSSSSTPASKGRSSAKSKEKSAYFECDVCHKGYASKEGLKRHMYEHTQNYPIRCSECGKGFAHSSILANHLRIHSGEKPHLCTYGDCGKRFRQKSHLNDHIRRCHTRDRLYKCDFCSKCFTSKSNLTVHRRTHSGEKPYPCHFCDLTFTQIGTRTKHENRIHGTDPNGSATVTATTTPAPTATPTQQSPP